MDESCHNSKLVMLWLIAISALVGVTFARDDSRKVVTVASDQGIQAAVQRAAAGTTIRVAPGIYKNWYWGSLALEGDSIAPIIIEAAEPDHPPVIDCKRGGQWKNEGIHLWNAKYVILRGLIVRNAKDNGILFSYSRENDWRVLGRDHGACHHVRIENCSVLNTNPSGNHDAIKLSGVEHFTVSNCWVEGWGGSGVDANGSRCGVIEDSVFVCSQNTHNNSAVTLKGGGDAFLIHRNFFKNSSSEQVIRIGDPEAANIPPGGCAVSAVEVAGNRFVAGATPVAWLSCDGGDVHHNTIVLPAKRFMRAWGRFDRSGPSFRSNLVIFDATVMKPKGYRVLISATPPEAVQKFSFKRNAWFEIHGGPSDVTTELPVPEEFGVYGVDPRLDSLDSPTMTIQSTDNRLRGIGADAYGVPALPPKGYGWHKTTTRVGPTYRDPTQK